MARSTRSGGKRGAPEADVEPDAVRGTEPSAQPPFAETAEATVSGNDLKPPADQPEVTGPDVEVARAEDAATSDGDHPGVADAELVDPAPDTAPPDMQTAAPERDAEPSGSPVAEATAPAAAAVNPAPTLAPAPVARPSFVPMVLGGVVAAALGYAAAWTDLLPRPPDPALTARLDDLAAAQSDLGQRIDDLAARPVVDDTARAGLEDARAAQAEAAADLAADLDAMAAQAQVMSAETVALGDRLTVLEDRPQVTVALSEQAQAAVEAQIAALRQEAADGIARVEEDRAALALQADERFAALEAELRATLAAIEAERAALEAARTAAAAEVRASRLSAAVADLRAALDAGAPYSAQLAALSDLEGAAPPDALAAHAENGIPSLASLREAFPEAARLALEQTLRSQVEAGEIGRVEGFMRIQSGVRSLTPQDGDDADAVLSRAEAALAAGDLAQAADLIAALPEPGRAAMQDWVDLAETRRAALAALATFGDS